MIYLRTHEHYLTTTTTNPEGIWVELYHFSENNTLKSFSRAQLQGYILGFYV